MKEELELEATRSNEDTHEDAMLEWYDDDEPVTCEWCS